MAHLIILDKNRDLIKRLAEGNVELTDIHEAMEALSPGATKTAAEDQLNDLLTAEDDALTDIDTRISDLKDLLGL